VQHFFHQQYVYISQRKGVFRCRSDWTFNSCTVCISTVRCIGVCLKGNADKILLVSTGHDILSEGCGPLVLWHTLFETHPLIWNGKWTWKETFGFGLVNSAAKVEKIPIWMCIQMIRMWRSWDTKKDANMTGIRNIHLPWKSYVKAEV